MNDDFKWETCEEEDVAYIIKVPVKQTDQIKLCVGREIAAYLKETGQSDAIKRPAKFPITIVDETCKDGKPIKKQLLDRFQLSVDRYGNHHFDIVYIWGVPYRIPLPH